MKVFVYGTLRKGEKNAFYLNESICIHQGAWIGGTLFDTKQGYPVMFLSNSGCTSEKVYGEVYEVNQDILERLDRLEGYVFGRADNLYERVTVKAYTDNTDVLEDVITYVAGNDLQHCSLEIALGDWKVYTYLQQSELYYFAYGSCMDDERFKLAHVNQYFTNILGRGVLNGYNMQFSRSTSDGGKADIVESAHSFTEGIIYRVPIEAIDYLYKREGVYTKGYRPAILTVSAGKISYDVLTFIGLDKQSETAPTTLYATEIIRGATGVLSASYIKQMEDKIADLTQKFNV